MAKLTHIDERNRPAMVDVGDKAITLRTAVAEARVRFPAEVAKTLRAQGFTSKKGPVINTAVIDGVMAAKRTHELFPFCFMIGIEICN
ncbi:MAG: cyclic pyranopterin monophosphate synthase MoaC, partial [Steroidobacteraceae bacterium]